MKTAKILYHSKHITITEGTIFYPLSIILGTPLIWLTTQAVGVNIPIWSNFCYLFFCDTSISTYRNRSKSTLKIVWISSVSTVAAILIFQEPILRSVTAILGYMIYKNFHSEKLAPFMFGYTNIAVLTSSPYMGIVDKNTLEAFLQICLTGFQTLIGFSFSVLFMFFYHQVKKFACRGYHG